MVFVVGAARACEIEEWIYLLNENVKDEASFIKGQTSDTKTKTSREFLVTAGITENFISCRFLELFTGKLIFLIYLKTHESSVNVANGSL